MPYCPKCKYEYKPDRITCPDCGAALVDAVSSETAGRGANDEPLEVVFKAQEPHEAQIIKTVLENAGIKVAEKHYRTPWMMERMDFAGLEPVYSRLVTLSSQADEARRIIAQFFEDYHQGKLELPDDTPSSPPASDKKDKCRRKF